MTRAESHMRAAAAWLLFALVSWMLDVPLMRALAWLPLILWLPGRLYLAAAEIETGSAAERALLSVAFSLVNVVIGGFVLGALHALTPWGWGAWLVATCAFAWSRVSGEARDEIAFSAPRLVWLRGLRPRHVGVLALAGAGVVAAFTIAIHDEAADRQFQYTAFWMTPRRNAAQILEIGVRNEERNAADYEVEFTLDARALESWPSVRLEPGAESVRAFVAPPLKKGRHRIEARLFKDGDRARLYRRAFIDIDNGEV